MLRRFTANLITPQYLSWLNDKRVNRYLECRFTRWTKKNTLRYFKGLAPNQIMWGIFYQGQFIGTARLDIDSNNGYGTIGLLLDSAFHNNGIGTETVLSICDYAFKKRKLHKLIAGFYSENVPSLKVFLNAGFRPCGIWKNHYKIDNGYMDKIWMERFR